MRDVYTTIRLGFALNCPSAATERVFMSEAGGWVQGFTPLFSSHLPLVILCCHFDLTSYASVPSTPVAIVPSVPLTHQARFCLGAFALAVPLPGTFFPTLYMAPTPMSLGPLLKSHLSTDTIFDPFPGSFCSFTDTNT